MEEPRTTPRVQTPLKQLRSAIKKEKPKAIRRLLGGMHPAKVASLLEALPEQDRFLAWDQIEDDRESEVLAYLSPAVKVTLSRETDGDDGEERTVEGGSTLQALLEALDKKRLKRVRRILSSLHPARVAGLLEALPPPRRHLAWEMLDAELGARAIPHLHDEVRTGLVTQTDREELPLIIRRMELDDVVDLLQDLPQTLAHELLQAVDAQKRQRLSEMLSYPEDSAGGLMNTDQITVRPDVSLRTVLRYLQLLEDLPPNTDKLLVVDRSHRYEGVLRLRHLLTNRPERTVSEVMDRSLEPILATESDRDVARLFEQEDLLSAPVVNDQGILLGRITVDDVVDVIRDQSEQSLMRMAGLDEEEDMFAPIMRSTGRRALWLGINLGTAFLAAWVIGLFEGTLDKIVALAVLLPIVASMGGIAGSQTMTLMVRGLALGSIETGNAARLMGRETAIGLLNGLLWSIVVGFAATAWFGNYGIGGVIAAAMIINLLFAALAGVAIPLLMHRFGVDPALAGGVVLTTVTDVIGFFAFLGLATILLL